MVNEQLAINQPNQIEHLNEIEWNRTHRLKYVDNIKCNWTLWSYLRSRWTIIPCESHWICHTEFGPRLFWLNRWGAKSTRGESDVVCDIYSCVRNIWTMFNGIALKSGIKRATHDGCAFYGASLNCIQWKRNWLIRLFKRFIQSDIFI